MKKYIIIYILLNTLEIFSQNNCETKIQELNRAMNQEIEKSNAIIDGAQGVRNSAISGKYFELITKAKAECDQMKQKKQEIDDANYNKKRVLSEQKNQDLLTQSNYESTKIKIQNYNNGINQLHNSISQLSNTLSGALTSSILKREYEELSKRNNVGENYLNNNKTRLDAILNMYSSINPESFNKPLKNGLYNAHFIEQKSLTFLNNELISVETNCIVEVVDNKINNIYLYGKEEFKLDLPQKFPNNSKIEKGHVSYQDYKNLKSYDVLIIEPYLSDVYENVKLIKGEYGEIIFWTNNNDEEGKNLYIQEFDKNQKLIREFTVELIFAKSENELLKMETLKKYIVNSNSHFYFMGEKTKAMLGFYELAPLVNKKMFEKPIEKEEFRVVEIKKYRM